MKEQLIDKIDTDKNQDNVNIRNINYSMFFLLILACGYSFLFITMALNTSSMNNNLNKIIDVINRIDLNNINPHTNTPIDDDWINHTYPDRLNIGNTRLLRSYILSNY
jgi:hypothetical protein